MNRFLGTFISGTGEIVEGMLRQRLKDLRLVALSDGAAEFETGVPYSDLNLFCFNNIFRVLHKGELADNETVLDGYLKELPASQPDWAAARENSSKIRSFRLVTSRQNRLVSVNPALRERLEKTIAKMSGLRLDRSRPDTEFWLLSRDDGSCYFLKRLSRHTAYDKLLDPGELHPELAYMMCWLTVPKYTDIVLDPFCGYGAIPLQRCRRFPFARLYAFDKSEKALGRTREKLPRKNPHIVIRNQDVLTLSKALPPESVDAVITDPPWGFFEDVGMELEEFYRKTLEQLDFVLKPGGRLVLLTAKKEEFRRAVGKVPRLSFRKEYGILVSGKKTGLYLIEKNPEAFPFPPAR